MWDQVSKNSRKAAFFVAILVFGAAGAFVVLTVFVFLSGHNIHARTEFVVSSSIIAIGVNSFLFYIKGTKLSDILSISNFLLSGSILYFLLNIEESFDDLILLKIVGAIFLVTSVIQLLLAKMSSLAKGKPR